MSGPVPAGQAVAEAREHLIGFALAALPNEVGFAKAEELADALVRAVEARCVARIQRHLDEHYGPGEFNSKRLQGAINLIRPNTQE